MTEQKNHEDASSHEIDFNDPQVVNAWLVEVDRLGPALGYGAESAASRAKIAQHHKGRRLVVPALADIGAMGAFAHGMQAERARQPLQAVIVFASWRAGLQPLRFGGRHAARGLNLNEFHHNLIVAGTDLMLRRSPKHGPTGASQPPTFPWDQASLKSDRTCAQADSNAKSSIVCLTVSAARCGPQERSSL